MNVENAARRARPLTALVMAPAIPIAAALPTVAAQASAGDAIPGSMGATAFYAAAATAVSVFVLLNAALKNRVGLYYACLFAVMLAVVWVLDRGAGAVPLGLAASLERTAAMALALAGCALGFLTAERAISGARAMTGFRRALLALTGISLLLVVAVWFLPETVAVPAANGLLAAMLVCHAVPAVTWRRSGDAPFRLPAVTAAILFAVVTVLFPVYGLSAAGGAAFDPAWLRWLFALVAMPAMVAIALAVLDLGHAREAALQEAVTAAEEKAETAAALLEMEKSYARARDIAARQTRRVSTVAHDIRQPIAALRAELDALKTDIDDVHADRFARILDHFDALTGDLTEDRMAGGPAEDGAPTETAEDVPAALLFSMLERLFAAEARNDGMELRFVASSAVFHAPAAALIRIASNLVGNAISHSGGERVLVGVRPSGDRLRLVILDNGRGFGAGGIGAVRAAGLRGADSTGSGLGLSIVDELAARSGFTLDAATEAGQGSAFALSVPRAARP